MLVDVDWLVSVFVVVLDESELRESSSRLRALSSISKSWAMAGPAKAKTITLVATEYLNILCMLSSRLVVEGKKKALEGALAIAREYPINVTNRSN